MSTEQQLAELLEFVKTTAEESKGFVVQEAPLLAQEIVAWEFWIGICYIASSVMLITVVSFLWRGALMLINKHGDDETKVFAPMIAAVISGLLLILSSLPAISEGIPRTIKASVAPRLVIVEYIGRVMQ